MNFIIRPATASDAEPISRLVAGVAHHFLVDPSAPEAGPFLAGLTPSAFAKRIDSSAFSHFVAEDSDGLCGVVALGDGSHLYHLFVRADVHGRGVARALWEHAKVISSQSTFTVNSSLFAVPVYERFGFIAKTPPQTANGVAFVPMEYKRDS